MARRRDRVSQRQAAKRLGLPDATLRALLAEGAPKNADGSIDLVALAAWSLARAKGETLETVLAHDSLDDFTATRPTDLVRAVNQAAGRDILSDRELRRHRHAARLEGRTVNVDAWLEWVLDQQIGSLDRADDPDLDAEFRKQEAYAHHKTEAARRSQERSQAGREIGPLPEVVDVKRKASAARDLRRFCELYLPERFSLAWGEDHLRVIARIETAVLGGGQFAVAMPRGSGKTTLTEGAAIWALAYGHRHFVAIVAAEKGAAKELLASLKVELESNDYLLADFPELCHAIRRLEGITARCRGQLLGGERTRITWEAEKIVLPTVAGSPSSGAVITCTGITGRIRGQKLTLPSGETLRPDLAIVDDPQTEESARSLGQTNARESTVNGAVLGLAGPGEQIAAIMPCTVIARGDLASRFLDSKRNPLWQSERTQMLRSLPTNLELWDKYAGILIEGIQSAQGTSAAREFYCANRAAMDEGAAAAWPARFNDDEESAIENAMRLRIRDPVTFAAEYQNEPEDPTAAAGEQRLDADAIARKVSGYKRGIVPITATTITAMIDCQATLLYWMVVAWESNFTGYVLDYGSFPDQGLRYFTLASARYTLANIEHEGVQLGASIEARLRKGLDLLVGPLLERRWKRDDGAELQIDRLLIDAGYKTSVVFKFAREHAGSARILPSFGRGITAGRKPMSEYKRKPGEKTGEDWIIPLVKRQRSVRHVLFDSNRWKTFFHARLATPIGERGSLSLFEGTPVDHRMIGEHLDAESPTDTFGQGRHCQEWHAKPGRDNHLLDCIVGASVGASIEGVTLEEVLAGDVATTRKKKKLTLGQMRARKRL